MIVGLCLTAFFSTCLLTYLIRRYALAKSLIDIPNARSSHSVPTPRGGGLAIVIVCLALPLWLAGVILFDTVEWGDSRGLQSVSSIFAFIAVAGIGFWDDHKHIPARWRLLVHFGASALVLINISQFPVLSIFGFTIANQWLLFFLYLFGLVWLLNLYNFMDGIDGIASIEAITVALSAAALLFMRGENSVSYSLILFSSTIAGFLVWNFPPAKIFMGDACSGFLGFSLGWIALITSDMFMPVSEWIPVFNINLWSWLILLAVFITDATFTLIKRVLNGDVWYDAHSSHAYQHYARQLIHHFQEQGFEHHDARTKSHRCVNLHMTLINIFWLFPLAAMATFYPYWAFLITVIAYLPLIFIAYTLKAGITE
jgi:Fuc2NAc and GlcNAc transferase